jgi:hypothetical protein
VRARRRGKGHGDVLSILLLFVIVGMYVAGASIIAQKQMD